MNKPTTIDFLDRFADAWNRHDVEAIVSMMTPDAVMFMSGGPTVEGRRVSGREALQRDISTFFESMPDAQWRDARHFIAGDRGVTQWTFIATRADGSKVELLAAMCSPSVTDISRSRTHIESRRLTEAGPTTDCIPRSRWPRDGASYVVRLGQAR